MSLVASSCPAAAAVGGGSGGVVATAVVPKILLSPLFPQDQAEGFFCWS